MTAYSSATSVTVDIIQDLNATTATDYWTEGAWSEVQGYPRAIAYHENRVWYAGTAEEPLRIWGTALDDFENFQLGVTDGDAVDFTLGSPRDNLIQWMLAQRESMMIGTSAGEFTLTSRAADQGITATNVTARQQSNYGSEDRQALLINDSLVFLQRVGRKIREFAYNWERDAYSAQDLTLLAEHITLGGVEQMDFQQQPIPILWGVTGDGNLISLVYEREQDVIAWACQETEGSFESVAVIPGSQADEVWVTVKRTINGATKRFVERFDPYTMWHHLISTDSTNSDETLLVFTDASVKTTLGPGTTVTGLSHLNSEACSVRVDGATHPEETPSGGSITLDYSGTEVSAGLAYTSPVENLPMVATGQYGSTKGQIGRIHRLVLDLYRSRSLQYTHKGADASDSDWDDIPFRSTSDPMDSPPPLFTGKKDVAFAGNYDLDVTAAIRQKQPQPMTLLSLTVKWDKTQTI